MRVIVALAAVAVEELLALDHQLVVAVTALRFLVGLGRFYLPFLLVFQERDEFEVAEPGLKNRVEQSLSGYKAEG